jgi:endonuclease III
MVDDRFTVDRWRSLRILADRLYLMTKKERVSQICERLRATYPDAHCELDFATPLQLLVATILSAQCTDKRVNQVTPELFRKYRNAHDFASVSQTDLEEQIKSTGFFRNKAKNIRAMARDLVEKYQGEVPQTMAELTALAGVGRKTANVVLGNAFSVNEGIVVDTHVARLAGRLRLTSQRDPERIELELMKLVPPTQWTNFSHWLIWHGRRRCHARNPDCPRCEINDLCPSRRETIAKDPQRSATIGKMKKVVRAVS